MKEEPFDEMFELKVDGKVVLSDTRKEYCSNNQSYGSSSESLAFKWYLDHLSHSIIINLCPAFVNYNSHEKILHHI